MVCAEKVKKTLEETAELVGHSGQRVLPLVVDVARPEDVERMADRISSEFGKLDIAVHNAELCTSPIDFMRYPLKNGTGSLPLT